MTTPFAFPLGAAGIFGNPQAPKRQRFIEGGKFTGKDAIGLALGAIGDAFTGQPVTSQLLLGGIADRRKAEQQAQLAAQQRAAGLEDFAAKRRIEIDNPVPDVFDRALKGAGIDPNSERGRQFFADRAASLASNPNDEFISVEIPGRGRFNGPRSEFKNFIAGPAPARPVGGLRPLGGQATTPQMTVTPIELDALVRKFGPQRVQADLDSGILAVRSK